MIDPRVWRQARRLLVRARRAAASQLGGSHRSLFRGAGLAFEEVRPYEPGDDVRSIDWNVTARFGQPFVKRYVEEREMPWLLMIDVSRSMAFGSAIRTKRDVAAELAALAAAVALYFHDRVGLLLFSDRIEAWLPPRKGSRAALKLLHTALFFEPKGQRTHFDPALRFAARAAPRRALVLMLSDFQGELSPGPLRALGRKHDLIAVRLTDPRERHWPDIGLAALADGEAGVAHLVETGAAAAAAARQDALRRTQLAALLLQAEGDLVDADAGGGAAEALLAYFRRRAVQRRFHAR